MGDLYWLSTGLCSNFGRSFHPIAGWYRHLFDWLGKPDSSPPYRSRSAILPKGKASALCLSTDLSFDSIERSYTYDYDRPNLAQSGFAHSSSHSLLDWNCGFVDEKGNITDVKVQPEVFDNLFVMEFKRTLARIKTKWSPATFRGIPIKQRISYIIGFQTKYNLK